MVKLIYQQSGTAHAVQFFILNFTNLLFTQINTLLHQKLVKIITINTEML